MGATADRESREDSLDVWLAKRRENEPREPLEMVAELLGRRDETSCDE